MGKPGYLVVRKRDATGRWPQALQSTSGRRVVEPAPRRHPRLKSEVKKGIARNTRRGKAGGDTLSARGRRGVVDRRGRPKARRETAEVRLAGNVPRL